jgi:hypothetical protein
MSNRRATSVVLPRHRQKTIETDPGRLGEGTLNSHRSLIAEKISPFDHAFQRCQLLLCLTELV